MFSLLYDRQKNTLWCKYSVVDELYAFTVCFHNFVLIVIFVALAKFIRLIFRQPIIVTIGHPSFEFTLEIIIFQCYRTLLLPSFPRCFPRCRLCSSNHSCNQIIRAAIRVTYTLRLLLNPRLLQKVIPQMGMLFLPNFFPVLVHPFPQYRVKTQMTPS